MIGGALRSSGGSAGSLADFYLHQLSLADATQFGNSEDILASVSMEHNGIEVVLQNGATATVDSMEAGAVGWSWPIELVRDVAGRPLTAPQNLAEHSTMLAFLERSVSVLPTHCWGLWGFCEGPDPSDSTGQGLAIGMDWASTTLRRTRGARRTDTWTHVIGATGTDTCFGSRSTIVGHGTGSAIQCRATPLDAAYNPLAGTTNIAVYVAATAPAVNLVDHVFLAFGWTAQQAGTPTIRVDSLIRRAVIEVA